MSQKRSKIAKNLLLMKIDFQEILFSIFYDFEEGVRRLKEKKNTTLFNFGNFKTSETIRPRFILFQKTNIYLFD